MEAVEIEKEAEDAAEEVAEEEEVEAVAAEAEVAEETRNASTVIQAARFKTGTILPENTLT